jgi:hypothetical protein
MNREWHEQHPMPPNATLQQRIIWHIAHAAECGCREIPQSVKRALEEDGKAVPPRQNRP